MSHTRISSSVGVLICAGTLIMGCSGTTEAEDADQETSVDQEADSSPTETDSPEPTPVAEEEGGGESGDPDEREEREPVAERLNERGNLLMPENNPYYLLSPDDDSVIAEFEFSDARPDVTCTSPYAPEPSGALLAFDVSVTVEPEARPFIPDGALLTSDMFQILDRDGQVVDSDPGSTMAAYSCPDQGAQFPFGAIRPGTSGSGEIVVESSVDSGYIVFNEVMSDTYLEWEFDLNWSSMPSEAPQV